MRIAVILTGALRTIKKTIGYLKKNVLHATQTPNDSVHVFACIQNDTSQSEEEWNAWFTERIGDHLKSMVWFAPDRFPEWIATRDRLLEHMHLDEGWKNYLRTSGSMIEYFQLHLAYQKMCHHEQEKYDYLIRARTDTIYNKAVDFHWLRWSDEEIGTRVDFIRHQLDNMGVDVTDTKIMNYFMNTIISDDLILNMKEIMAEYCPSADVKDSCVLHPHLLGEYIRNGRYILTIRRNNLYVVRRDLFHMIPSLAFMYGQLTSPYSDAYWFNAECQFRSACYHSCLTIFDYNTLLEDKSLRYAHEWNEEDFFVDGVCDPRMLFCVVRK
jgi:hypothetical protein